MPETASRVPKTRNSKIMKKMYKKPEIETMVLPEEALMGFQNPPTDGSSDPQSQAPSRATRAGDPY